MMESFKKVIDKLILPEFRWVIDYHISIFELFEVTWVMIFYYTDGEFEVNEDRYKLMDNTRSLYDMIGGEDYYVYGGVTITSIENKHIYE